MDIRQLTYFTAIADAGSVTGAARELHMSQPPLSAQLRLLEEELGCLLFERNTRHLQLTEEGKALYARAAEILELCSSARMELRDRKAGKAGTLRLGAVTSISGTLFPALLGKFHREFPAVRVELSENNTYELLDMVRAGRVEAALVRMPFSAADLQVTHLQNEPLCVAGRLEWFSGHRGEKVTLTELADVPLLVYRRWKRILGDAFLQEGLRPDVFCVCDDARTAVRLAQEGFGVAVVPRSAVEVGRFEHACAGEKGRLECAAGSGKVDCAESGRLECAVGSGSVECAAESGKLKGGEAEGLSVWDIDDSKLCSEICTVCRKDQYISHAARNFLAIATEMLGRGGAVRGRPP